MIDSGDIFPSFSLCDQHGSVHTDKELLGLHTILYFYPKDDTPGCTKESCDFRDLVPQLNSTQLYGVSCDSVASHQKFAKKYQLEFPLLADVEHELVSKLGIWVEKSMFGKKYFGLARTTYLVGPDGVILNVWRKVNPLKHAKEVQAALRKLTN